MSDTINDLKKVLENLIETCKDGAYGYRKAADKVREDDPSLSGQWEQHAATRDNFVRELEERLECIGHDGEEGGSIAGALHRGWIDVKAAFSSNEVPRVVDECIRGEESAEKAYNQALEAKMDMATRDVVQRQSASVTACRRELEAIKMTLSRS